MGFGYSTTITGEIVFNTGMYYDNGRIGRFDVANYERKNIIKIRQIIDTYSNEVKNYSLTIKGRQLFSKMLEKYNGEQFEIKELLGHYQSERTNYKILKFVYENYPDYLGKSRIKDKFLTENE